MESITDKFIKSIKNADNDTNFDDLYDEFMSLLSLEKEMNKYKIGMELELNYEFDYNRCIITELDWHEEKNEPLLIVAIIHNDRPKTAPKDERWVYLNQVRRIIQ